MSVSGDHIEIDVRYVPHLCTSEYLRDGGRLEIGQQMADCESARTTLLQDQRDDHVGPGQISTARRYLSWEAVESHLLSK